MLEISCRGPNMCRFFISLPELYVAITKQAQEQENNMPPIFEGTNCLKQRHHSSEVNLDNRNSICRYDALMKLIK